MKNNKSKISDFSKLGISLSELGINSKTNPPKGWRLATEAESKQFRAKKKRKKK